MELEHNAKKSIPFALSNLLEVIPSATMGSFAQYLSVMCEDTMLLSVLLPIKR